MADLGCEILFLVDRLGSRAEVDPVRKLVESLGQLGHDSTILCLSAPVDHGLDDLIECPGLGRRWQRSWALRGLDLDEEPGKARLMHVLSNRMSEVALAVAERWRIPYLLGIEEFPRRDFRLRISRAWCRGLVVPNRELAGALIRDFGVPAPLVHEIRPSPTPPDGPPRPVDRDLDRVPVIGAAGPLVASSGFATFLNAARKVVDQGFDAEFLIAGHGDDEGDLRRRAERLRIAERLTFADDLPVGLSFWHVLDVYCQTSIAPTVGQPLRMAMAGAVPSISTDVEGLRTLIRPGENGLVVPHGDASALAASIVELLQDRPRARLLGEEARRNVSQADRPGGEAEALDALYRKVIGDELGRQASGPTRRTSPPDDDRGRMASSGLDEDAFPRLSGGP